MIFNYKIKTNLIFGCDSSKKIGEEAAALGKKAIIVTGGSSTKKSGLLDHVKSQLDEAGVDHILFDEAQPNPFASIAEKGAAAALKAGCDLAIALGGGSVIDTAKGICARARNDMSIIDMIYKGFSITDSLPMIAVPTTCGTGSEVNGIGVLTNEANNDKKAIKGPAVVPDVSIVDPKLMMTMPKSVYASVAFDALCHLTEAYLSTGATKMSDMMALKGMHLMKDNLVKVYENYEDIEAWENVTFASTLGGYTLNEVSVIAPHGMDHPLGGLKNAQHGKGLAALTPVVFEELADYAPVRLGEIAKIFGGKDAKDCSRVILELLRKIDLDVTLEELGFEGSDIEWLTDNTVNVQSFVMSRTPAPWKPEDISRLFARAMTYNKEV